MYIRNAYFFDADVLIKCLQTPNKRLILGIVYLMLIRVSPAPWWRQLFRDFAVELDLRSSLQKWK